MSRISRVETLLRTLTPRLVDDPTRSPAAVALIFAEAPVESVLFIQRAEFPGDPWSGQIAFPGGRKDPADPDLLATAVRETQEELAFDLRSSRFLGILDDLAPVSPHLPPVVVRPHLFIVPAQAALTPNAEVAQVFWTPLDQLLDPSRYRPYRFQRGERVTRHPGYHLPQGVVWGMTERILTPVLKAAGGS